MATIINTATMDPSDMSQDELDYVYNGLDITITAELYSVLKTSMKEDVKKTYALSKALMGPILDMTVRGFLVSKKRKHKLLPELRRDLSLVEKRLDQMLLEVFDITGFNHKSPKQLADLLYGVCLLPEKKKYNKATGKRTVTTDRKTLEDLRVNWLFAPLINLILTARDIEKMIQFLETPLGKGHRLYSTFNIAGTKTGRLSSSTSAFGDGTNSQNINKKLKQILIPDKGKLLFNMDLEQADSRNIGATAWSVFYKDKGPEFAGAYLNACESGDLHTYVCRMAWPELDWPDDPSEWRAVADQKAYRHLSYRDLAKALGHGTNYMGTPRTMAGHARVPTKQIAAFQEAYFAAFPEIKALHEWVIEQLLERQSLTTIWGRKRNFYDRVTTPQVHRQAIAYMGQSPTADEINHAMLGVFSLKEVELLLQVHDSLTGQFDPEILMDIMPKIIDKAQAKLTLPGGREFYVPVDAEVGWFWKEQGKDGSHPGGMIKWGEIEKAGGFFSERPKDLYGTPKITFEDYWG